MSLKFLAHAKSKFNSFRNLSTALPIMKDDSKFMVARITGVGQMHEWINYSVISIKDKRPQLEKNFKFPVLQHIHNPASICNGLLLLLFNGNGKIDKDTGKTTKPSPHEGLWNPTTSEIKTLPPSPASLDPSLEIWVWDGSRSSWSLVSTLVVPLPVGLYSLVGTDKLIFWNLKGDTMFFDCATRKLEKMSWVPTSPMDSHIFPGDPSKLLSAKTVGMPMQSLLGKRNEIKRKANARGNWETQTDELTQVTKEVVNEGEKTVGVESPQERVLLHLMETRKLLQMKFLAHAKSKFNSFRNLSTALPIMKDDSKFMVARITGVGQMHEWINYSVISIKDKRPQLEKNFKFPVLQHIHNPASICNGLLLLLFNGNGKIDKDTGKTTKPSPHEGLWNPTTSEIKTLPPSPASLDPRCVKMAHFYFGFGFDSASEDYKVIRLLKFRDDNKHIALTPADTNNPFSSLEIWVWDGSRSSWSLVSTLVVPLPVGSYSLVGTDKLIFWNLKGDTMFFDCATRKLEKMSWVPPFPMDSPHIFPFVESYMSYFLAKENM
ncbi:F-box protein [Striga asiatica]|uniref:F-box protein n=1 Tax=Striga asiatica TaxID=4170 RepID=A0A5A7R5B9_STRAF|nr:F-box protein [Striga asiatica]